MTVQVVPDLFAHSTGPRDARIVIVGEAWGEQEARIGIPFQGAAGRELDNLLREAGLSRGECFVTNVFNLRPANNDLTTLCGPKAAGIDGFPALQRGKHLLPQYWSHVERLWSQIREIKPNLVLAMGATAAWALLGTSGIRGVRGYITGSPFVESKVLPTYHPAAILRAWSLRPIVLADLLKAKREREYPEIRRKSRLVLVNPTLQEIADWWQEAKTSPELSVDIETHKRQISMIGFAQSDTSACVVPFHQPELPDYNYWSFEEEVLARAIVAEMLESPAIKIFQNGLYDLQYLWREGFRVANATADTMLLQHALYPEMEKGLGFLGSIHTNEQSWKLSRKRASDEVVKKDE